MDNKNNNIQDISEIKHDNASFYSDIKRQKEIKRIEAIITKKLEKAEEIAEKQKKKSEKSKLFIKKSNKHDLSDTSIIPTISLEDLNKKQTKKKFSLFSLFFAEENENNSINITKSNNNEKVPVMKEKNLTEEKRKIEKSLKEVNNKATLVDKLREKEEKENNRLLEKKKKEEEKLANELRKKEEKIKKEQALKKLKEEKEIEELRKEQEKIRLRNEARLKEEEKKNNIEAAKESTEIEKEKKELEEKVKKNNEREERRRLRKEAKLEKIRKKEEEKQKILEEKERIRKEKEDAKQKEIDEKERIKRAKKEKEELRKAEEERKKEEEKILSGQSRERIEEEKNKVKELKEKEKADIEEKKRLEREKKDEKRKEKLRVKFEKEQLKKKAKEEAALKKQKEKNEKRKQIEREKNQSREEMRAKAEMIKKAKEEARMKARAEHKTLKERAVDWYNNLSFVKDAKNKYELQRETLLLDINSEDSQRSNEEIMYKYVAKSPETGKVETGYFAAFSKLDVHSFLLAEGYEVYEITPQTNYRSPLRLKRNKITSSELDFFLTQLSTFLKSGITLVESVKILSKQATKVTTKNLYKSLVYELSMGENFSEALDKQGNVFPKLLINMVKTSELTGNLPETLDDMAAYYKETGETKKQMIGALTYPAIILVFAISVLIYIMVSVIPQFISIYDSLDAPLPKITVAIINISNFLQSYWIWLIFGLFVFIIVFIILFKTIKVFKTVMQSFVMNIPLLGKIIIYNEVTMFTKTFASLLNHSVYITDCMEVLSKITNNEIYKMLIFDTITNLAKGEAISNSFKNHWAFPTIAYEMILTGEKTGQLGNMMDKVAKYYQLQHKNLIGQIKAFIEPVLIVALAVIIGIVLLAVILPMFDLYQNVGV